MYLSELTKLPGVSGNENCVRSFIKEKVEPFCDRIEIDSIGNLLAFKKGYMDTGKTLMLCAHMDEVGLIVSRITEEGFLKFKTVGGIDPRVLVSKRVLVGNKQLPGVIGRKAIHLLSADERKQAPKVKELYVDIGAKNKKDAEKRVAVGDYIAFASRTVTFGDNLMKAKALDDRVGCSVMLELLKEPCPWDLCFTFTVQEEVGLRGAKVCAKRVKPDLALVLEGTTCSDTPGTDVSGVSTRLGGGAALSLIDGATVYNRELVLKLHKLATDAGVTVQFKQTATGGNDAGAIHLASGGVPTVSVSIPARYIHSPSSVISLSDYEAVRETARLLMQEVDNV